jgi:uncharacterized protein YbjT (DUF2867 family)
MTSATNAWLLLILSGNLFNPAVYYGNHLAYDAIMRNKLITLILLSAIVGSACSDSSNTVQTERKGKTILVTGATGTQGGAVARELLSRGYIVRGLSRNPDSERARAMSDLGVEMLKGDFDDPDSLAAAMDSAYGVFAVTNFWEHGYETEVTHGKQLVDAAIAAGVKHFVFTSVASADDYTGIPHFDSKGEIEIYLRESGINYSIVRPVEFMDNIAFYRKQIMTGTYYDPRDSGKTHQWIAASDIGFFVGVAFDNPDQWFGKALDIAGDELSIAEYVDVLSFTMGLDIHHQQVSWAAYEADAGEHMAVMVRWFDKTGYSVDVEALRKEYPGLLTYEQYLLGLEE